MNIIFPIVELIDRYTIACVKFENTNGLNKDEFEFYKIQISDISTDRVSKEIDQLISVHKKIWALESLLKTGKDSMLSLEEIGKRAIEIRNWNNNRIELKNKIASMLNKDSVREVKKDHISE